MFYSKSNKLLFIHVPKNAGTLIRSALKNQYPNSIDLWGVSKLVDMAHLMPHQFPKQIKEAVNDPELKILAMLRDPYERAFSAYQQHCRQYANHPKLAQSFEDYLEAIKQEEYRKSRDGYIFIHGAPQVKFLYYKDCLLPNILLNCSGEWKSKLDQVLKCNLKYKNSSIRKTPRLSSDNKENIEAIYREDFVLFENLIKYETEKCS